MNQSNKQAGFSAVIVLVAVLVLAGAGFAAWRISQASKADRASQDTEVTNETRPMDDTRSSQKVAPEYTYPTAEWNDYKSEKLGFSFKYPKDWNEIDVRFDGSDGFYMALFAPTGEWAGDDLYEKASIELRGNSAEKTQDNHGEYSKGFYKKDGKYYRVGGESGDSQIPDNEVLSYYNGELETLLATHINLANYEVLELMVNLEGQKVLGLDLKILHAKTDQSGGQAFTQNDVSIMKQIAASFKKL